MKIQIHVQLFLRRLLFSHRFRRVLKKVANLDPLHVRESDTVFKALNS